MSYYTAIIQGVLLGLFIAISVGPTLFAIIRYSTSHSARAGMAFVLGVSFSDILYVTLANIATSWLEFLEDHQREVGYIGSTLFIVMGLYGLLKKFKPRRHPRPGEKVLITTSGYLKIGLSGFLMNLLNPAVILLWVGSVTMVSGADLLHRLVLFGICLGIVLSFDFLKVFLAEKIRYKLNLRNILYLNRISALFILLLGLLLLARAYFGWSFSH